MNIIEETYQWANGLNPRTETNYIVLHHADAVGIGPQDVHRWHLNNGWAGIGYNFFVAQDGTVYRGRPVEVAGAHCYGFNSQSVGICAEGDYEASGPMPDPQKVAIVELIRELLVMYPQAQIVGHRDLSATACPGANYPFDEIVSLAMGTGQTDTLAEAVTKLQQAGIIVSPDYWLQNARPEMMVKGEYVARLIETFAKRL